MNTLEDLEQEILFRGDVVVEAALQDPDCVGDVLNRSGLITLLVKDASCRLENLFTAASRRPCTAPARPPGFALRTHAVPSVGVPADRTREQRG